MRVMLCNLASCYTRGCQENRAASLLGGGGGGGQRMHRNLKMEEKNKNKQVLELSRNMLGFSCSVVDMQKLQKVLS